jgi:hypothetical protein
MPEDDQLNRIRKLGDRLWIGAVTADEREGRITSLNLDGSEEEEEDLLFHHDFLVRDEGMLFIQQLVGTGPDGSAWVGDRLVERIDGEERELWNTFDGASVEMKGEDFYKDGLDWTHCNGLADDPEHEEVWMSCKHQQAIFVVAEAGGLEGILGGPLSTWTNGGSVFGDLHGPYVEGDHLYLFNNGGSPAAGEVYQLDRDKQTFSLKESYHEQGFSPEVYGNVYPTQTGGRVVSYGVKGLIQEYDTTGEETLRIESKSRIGYLTYLPALSGPL